MSKWGDRFLALTATPQSWSKDPSTQVGAVIARDKHLISMGYNGFATGVRDTPERLNNRETKYMLTIHSELNAILNSMPHSLEGCTIYISHPPCVPCTSAIIQVGIRHVVFRAASAEFLSRWEINYNLALEIMQEAEVAFIEVK